MLEVITNNNKIITLYIKVPASYIYICLQNPTFEICLLTQTYIFYMFTLSVSEHPHKDATADSRQVSLIRTFTEAP